MNSANAWLALMTGGPLVLNRLPYARSRYVVVLNGSRHPDAINRHHQVTEVLQAVNDISYLADSTIAYCAETGKSRQISYFGTHWDTRRLDDKKI
jgi:hypothetical protein